MRQNLVFFNKNVSDWPRRGNFRPLNYEMLQTVPAAKRLLEREALLITAAVQVKMRKKRILLQGFILRNLAKQVWMNALRTATLKWSVDTQDISQNRIGTSPGASCAKARLRLFYYRGVKSLDPPPGALFR